MYQADKLIDGLIDLVGWKGTNHNLQTSKTGLFYNGEHPLLTEANLKAIAPPESDFGLWLKEQTEFGIIKAVQRLLNEKLSDGTARNVLSIARLYGIGEGLGETTMAGFEIWPSKRIGVSLTIDRIGLAYENPCTVNLKLWHSSKRTPVETWTKSYTKTKGLEWFELKHVIAYEIGDIYGGVWFLTCETSEKPVLATTHSFLSKYVTIKPFSISPKTAMWDYKENQPGADGVNLRMTANADYTDFILNHKHQLQDLIAKQVAVHMLRELAYNPAARINRETANAKRVEILYELDGDSTSMKKSGLMYELQKAVDGIKLDFSMLDGTLFTRKSGRIRYGTI